MAIDWQMDLNRYFEITHSKKINLREILNLRRPEYISLGSIFSAL